MQQLTVRGFDLELEHHLRQVAKALNLSLNKAALYLMRKGAGLDAGQQPDVVGDSVDHLIGTWSAADAAEFHAATHDFERVDGAELISFDGHFEEVDGLLWLDPGADPSC